MYTIKCDGYPLLDLRDENLILVNPKVKVEVNKVGEGSFTIYNNHPYYNKLKKLKSIVEVSDEFGVIFRGRITTDTIDFYNGKAVDLEGVMAFFNDSIIRPYSFPEDFLEDEGYISASESGNVVEFFLNWLIEQHNSQVNDFQKFKLGNVTVSDPNNYITRSDTGYSNTFDVLKAKLFDSSLGGFLCIRYEEDGNYIDYLSEFNLTNTQDINYEENILDLKSEMDASEVYTAIIPIGAEIEVSSESGTEEEGTQEDGTETTETISKKKLTLESLADGDITDDIVKIGDTLYSKSAVDSYGWIYAPVSETTWGDVKETQNLLSKGTNWLVSQGMMLVETTEITAFDLHYTDAEIRSFRIYRKINVNSIPHGIKNAYDLTKLDIDILNPQNTKITVGETKLTLTDQANKGQSENIENIEEAIKDIGENRAELTEIKNQMIIQRTEIINTCNAIILGALESYVETGDYEEFRQTVESQLEILADEISLKFTESITQIENVNGDLQETNTTLSKYFEFTIDGLVIKSGESEIKLRIDNDIILFLKNGVPFGWWDGSDFKTGNIMVDVNERAQFGNFAFVPRSDGSLSFLKVGEYIVPVKIYSQPSDVTVASGGTATFSVSAMGRELSYQWQMYSADNEWINLTDFGTTQTGTTTNTLTRSGMYTKNTVQIRCVVTDKLGSEAISNVATLYVS